MNLILKTGRQFQLPPFITIRSRPFKILCNFWEERGGGKNIGHFAPPPHKTLISECYRDSRYYYIYGEETSLNLYLVHNKHKGADNPCAQKITDNFNIQKPLRADKKTQLGRL